MTATHHVRGGHHIRPGPNLAQGNPRQIRKGFIVVHVLPMQNAAVAVGGILTHTHIADEIQLREPVLQGLHGLLDHPVAAISL